MENTHREFEIAVQEAEFVLSESPDNHGLPLSNHVTNAPKIHNNESENGNIKPKTSATRSDIESDSGIESINSDLQRHQFQSSPLYSPIAIYPKNYASPASSSHLLQEATPENIGNANIVSEAPSLNSFQRPKVTKINENFGAPSFISNLDNEFQTDQIETINDIESNFPDVFGNSANGDLLSFSDIIEAETLKLFGSDDPNTGVNNVLSDNSTKNSLPVSIPQNNSSEMQIEYNGNTGIGSSNDQISYNKSNIV